MRIAIATCKDLPEADPDEALLVRALEEAGAAVRMLPWDGADEPAADELVVLRSTWNYYDDVDRFLAWVDRTAARTTLLNPASVVRANVRKTYLLELERTGLPIVPTAIVTAASKEPVAAIARDRGWPAIVIKPVVSAGSFLTERFDLSAPEGADAAQRFLDETIAARDMMVQAWMPSVDGYGERSLVWIAGELSHAIRKSPRFRGGKEKVSEAVPIADDERAFAKRALAGLEDQLLYARVDVVRDADEAVRLMELELVEPSLFLLQAPEGARRLVAAIVERAKRLG